MFLQTLLDCVKNLEHPACNNVMIGKWGFQTHAGSITPLELSNNSFVEAIHTMCVTINLKPQS